MWSTITAMLFIIAILPNPSSALGINCRGLCPIAPKWHAAKMLTDSINNINQTRWYRNGEQVACTTLPDDESPTHICAFLQNTEGGLGSQILHLAHYIPDHGCNVCGSVPYYYPSDNDVAHGELTYAGVKKRCRSSGPRGDGLCSSSAITKSSISFLSLMCIIVLLLLGDLWV